MTEVQQQDVGTTLATFGRDTFIGYGTSNGGNNYLPEFPLVFGHYI